MFLNNRVIPHFDTLAFDSPEAIEERSNTDGTKYWVVRLYNGSGGAVTAGAVYKVVYDGDEETNPKVVACTATATLLQNVVVATEATADAAWGWFAFKGTYSVLCNGDATDISKDDFLKIVVATDADAFVDDTTARTVNSFAIACEAETDATPSRIRVYLIGDPAVIS